MLFHTFGCFLISLDFSFNQPNVIWLDSEQVVSTSAPSSRGIDKLAFIADYITCVKGTLARVYATHHHIKSIFITMHL